MTNPHEQQITHAELSHKTRTFFESLIAHRNVIFEQYNVESVKQFLKAQPKREDINALITILKTLKSIAQTRTVTETQIISINEAKKTINAIIETKRPELIILYHNDNGIIAVEHTETEKQWHIKSDGTDLYPERYDEVYPFDQAGQAKVRIGHNLRPDQTKAWQINEQGQRVIGPYFDFTIHADHPATLTAAAANDEFYLLDRQGNVLAGPYEFGVSQFSKNGRGFGRKKWTEIYLLNEKGEEIGGPYKSFNTFFDNHYAEVQIGNSTEWIKIDKDGNEIKPSQ